MNYKLHFMSASVPFVSYFALYFELHIYVCRC